MPAFAPVLLIWQLGKMPSILTLTFYCSQRILTFSDENGLKIKFLKAEYKNEYKYRVQASKQHNLKLNWALLFIGIRREKGSCGVGFMDLHATKPFSPCVQKNELQP